MKINKDLLLHLAMAFAAVLVVSLPPFIDSVNPPLKFMPLIKTMEGTSKEQNERMATISHALQGNAIFFLGASEVTSSQNEPYAVFNYFNNDLHVPVVAYGNSMIENFIQFSILSAYKSELSEKTKLVLLISPDSFYFTRFPPVVLTRNLTGPVFSKLDSDAEVQPFLENFLQNADPDKIDHLSLEQMRLRRWNTEVLYRSIAHNFNELCDQVKHYYLHKSYSINVAQQAWPHWPIFQSKPDWNSEIKQAVNLNNIKQINVTNDWMEPAYFHLPNRVEEWYRDAPVKSEMDAFNAMLKMLKEKHVQVVAIIDPLNPWAIEHTERFKVVDNLITASLKANQIPYFDMYEQPYQNGWNRDYIHPTNLAWVAMDKFIYEHFL